MPAKAAPLVTQSTDAGKHACASKCIQFTATHQREYRMRHERKPESWADYICSRVNTNKEHKWNYHHIQVGLWQRRVHTCWSHARSTVCSIQHTLSYPTNQQSLFPTADKSVSYLPLSWDHSSGSRTRTNALEYHEKWMQAGPGAIYKNQRLRIPREMLAKALWSRHAHILGARKHVRLSAYHGSSNSSQHIKGR